MGWRLSKTAVAKIAAAALEDGLRGRKIDRLERAHAAIGQRPRVRREAIRGDRASLRALAQEYVTPTRPQNGMIERFFGTLKTERLWQHRFQDRDHAFDEVARWLDRYHADRQHSALGHLTPTVYRENSAP